MNNSDWALIWCLNRIIEIERENNAKYSGCEKKTLHTLKKERCVLYFILCWQNTPIDQECNWLVTTVKTNKNKRIYRGKPVRIWRKKSACCWCWFHDLRGDLFYFLFVKCIYERSWRARPLCQHAVRYWHKSNSLSFNSKCLNFDAWCECVTCCIKQITIWLMNLFTSLIVFDLHKRGLKLNGKTKISKVTIHIFY